VKLKQLAAIAGIAVSSIGASGAIKPASALTFNFTPAAGTSQLAIDGFNAAGALWSSVLSDPVSVNVNIDFKALDPGVLGESGAASQSFSYGQVYNAMRQDRSSANDNTAVNSLANSPTFKMLLNRTANSPNGAVSATPYLDNNGNDNNSTIAMTTANAKALGLQDNSGNDANISFSTGFTWDFDRNDGISAGAFDFVGIAAHEIGHALGFLSGVDVLDSNATSGYNDDVFTVVNPLDLFRYSTDSKNLGAIDFTADKREKYLSIDGGATKIAAFSTGDNFGDGNQASHWQENTALNLLNPKFPPGQLLQLSESDRLAFDAIGWNLAGSNGTNAQQSFDSIASNLLAGTANANAVDVPEPSNFIGTFICVAFGVKIILKRRQQLKSIEK
jgi:hypothetical protein